MNEIEERNGLDPEVAESIRSTAEEVAQSATDMAESHVEPVESLPDSEDSSPLSKEEEELLAQVMEEAHNEIPTNSGSLLIDESTSKEGCYTCRCRRHWQLCGLLTGKNKTCCTLYL